MSLDDGEIEEIIETYEEKGSINKTVQELSRGTDTVRKYVGYWQETGEVPTFDDAYGYDPDKGLQPDEPEDDPEADLHAMRGGDPPAQSSDPQQGVPEGWSAMPMPGVDDDSTDPDFGEMGYGEFVHWFFDQDSFGVDAKWKAAVANQCKVRQRIPDQMEMKRWIVEMSSGIADEGMAQMIAEAYYDAATRFLQAKQQSPQMGGTWQGPPQGGQQPQQPHPQGQWMGGQQGGHQQGPWQSQQPQNGQQPQQTNQPDPKIEKLEEKTDRMMQSMQQLIQAMRQDQQPQESVPEKLNEYVELKKTIQQLSDDGRGNDEMDAIIRKINELEQEIHRGAGEGNDQPVQVQDNESGLGVLANLAMRDDVDADTLNQLAQAFHVGDPDIKIAEYDFKKEQMRTEGRKELVDSALESLGTVAEGVSGVAVESMFGDDDDDDEEEEDVGPTERPRGPGGGRPPRGQVYDGEITHGRHDRDDGQSDLPSGDRFDDLLRDAGESTDGGIVAHEPATGHDPSPAPARDQSPPPEETRTAAHVDPQQPAAEPRWYEDPDDPAPDEEEDRSPPQPPAGGGFRGVAESGPVDDEPHPEPEPEQDAGPTEMPEPVDDEPAPDEEGGDIATMTPQYVADVYDTSEFNVFVSDHVADGGTKDEATALWNEAKAHRGDDE